MKIESTISGRRIVSEGKYLEVTPLLVDEVGQPRMLPPVIWPVENWMLGYANDHALAGPWVNYVPYRVQIPGSSANRYTQLEFLVRVLESGEQPRPAMALTEETMREFVAALKSASDTPPPRRS